MPEYIGGPLIWRSNHAKQSEPGRRPAKSKSESEAGPAEPESKSETGPAGSEPKSETRPADAKSRPGRQGEVNKKTARSGGPLFFTRRKIIRFGEVPGATLCSAQVTGPGVNRVRSL